MFMPPIKGVKPGGVERTVGSATLGTRKSFCPHFNIKLEEEKNISKVRSLSCGDLFCTTNSIFHSSHFQLSQQGEHRCN